MVRIPFAPTAAWMSEYLAACSNPHITSNPEENKDSYPLSAEGMVNAQISSTSLSEDGVSKANNACALVGKDFARTQLGGAAPVMLTVPVQGGGSVLKNRNSDPILSDHGKWRREHLGAWNAAYGRTPYFPHLFPEIEAVYLNSEGMLLRDFNTALIEVALHWLQIDLDQTFVAQTNISQTSTTQMFIKQTLTREQISATMEIKKKIDPNLTVFDALFRLGKSAALGFFSLIAILISFALPSYAEEDGAPELKLKVKAYEGFTRIVDEYGDTCRLTYIREIVVYPPMKFKNKKEEQYYWKTVRDVKRTLPYAKLAFSTLCETYEYIQTIPDKKTREEHLKRLEKDIFEEYKPVVKKMTKNQGKILLKLINRETDQSGYSIVKAFLGSFRAGFWQMFGRFFGMNMKSGFNPKKNKDDALIERIAVLVEQGAL